jgi:hypothetical protein
LLFIILGYFNKYNELLAYIKIFKQPEIKGDNIEEDFLKFFELDNKIAEKIAVIQEMIKEINRILKGCQLKRIKIS